MGSEESELSISVILQSSSNLSLNLHLRNVDENTSVWEYHIHTVQNIHKYK